MNIKTSKTQETHKPPKKPKKITATYLHNAGLYYLQRYASSVENFRRVMLRKVKRSCDAHPDQNYESCAGLVEDIITKFIRVGLLNDDIYTQGVISGLRRQGKSGKAIMGKLREKGVSADLAQKTLRDIDERLYQDADAELKAALVFARKKRLGPHNTRPLPEDAEERNKVQQKALGSFARAGFSYEISKKILEIDLYDTA